MTESVVSLYEDIIDVCKSCNLNKEAEKFEKKIASVTYSKIEKRKESSIYLPTYIKENSKKVNEIRNILEDAIIQLPDKCDKVNCHKLFTEEQLMDEWLKNKKEYKVKCPACEESFVPNLEIITMGITRPYYFFFPPLFVEGIENLIMVEGKSVLYSIRFYEEHTVLFWNTVFYFQLIKQPYFMLSLNFNESPLNTLLEYKDIPKDIKESTSNSFISLLGDWKKNKEVTMSRILGKSMEERKMEPISPMVGMSMSVKVETIQITKEDNNNNNSILSQIVTNAQTKVCIVF